MTRSGTAQDLRSDARDDHRTLLATACRVLAHTGLSAGVLGHISLRIGPDEMLVRCRGPHERGLAYTEDADIHRVTFDGVGDDLGDWAAPNELPIHTAVLRARPDVTAVVHAHPPAVVTTTLAHLQLQPIVGAFDIPAAKLAAGGIPTWPRAALVNTPELGEAVAAALGDRPVVLLYGHGLVSIGRNTSRTSGESTSDISDIGGAAEHAVAEAVVNAVAVDVLARTTLAVLAAGVQPTAISDADLRQLPDLGAGLQVDTIWRHLVAVTAAANATAAAPEPQVR